MTTTSPPVKTRELSRSFDGVAKADGGGDPLRPWNGTPRDIHIALTFQTSNLVEKVNETEKVDNVERWRGSSSEEPWCPPSDEFFKNLDLEKCLVERVTCTLVGAPDSVVSMCPSVKVYLGKEKKHIESLVRNGPRGCPLHDNSRGGTLVHQWNLTSADMDRCRKFGNFTAENLAKLGSECVRDGDCVTLPDCLGKLVAEEHKLRNISVTERGRAPHEKINAVEKTEFEHLTPVFLDAVSDVLPHFYDLTYISVDLNIDPTCERKDLNVNEMVTLIVCARVWCEENNAMKTR